METSRKWHFGFNEYYDVYIWDFEPGRVFNYLYNTVSETLFKAHRFHGMDDLYTPASSILQTITRDRVTFRTRDIKPGEKVMSIWNDIEQGGYITQDSKDSLPSSVFYSEPDVLEDAVLFPEEMTHEAHKALYSGKNNHLESFTSSVLSWTRFIQDLDTDEESLESEVSEDDAHFIENGSESAWSDEASQRDSVDSDVPDNRLISRSKTLSKEEKQDLAMITSWKAPSKYKENVEAEFMTFMDREKSKGQKSLCSRGF